MKRTIIAISVGVLVLALGGTGLGFYNHKRLEDRKDDAFSLAKLAVNIRSGDATTSTLKQDYIDSIGKEAYKSIVNYESSLVELDKAEFNVTDYMEENFENGTEEDATNLFGEDIGSSPSVGDTVNNIQEDNSTFTPTNDIDERITEKEGVAYIKVKDLNFSDDGTDIITYNGVSFPLSKEEVPTTYTAMKNDPSNKMSLTDNIVEGEENGTYYTDYQFQSITDDEKSLIVRVYHTKYSITGLEVRD